MTYPSDLHDSLAKVEASRERRMHETYPSLSPQERDQVLHSFHPDYLAETFRALRVGPNQGERTPRELAEALEAPAIILENDPILSQEPDAICDVLVIGGGGAGASAALIAQANGADVLLATKLRFGDANTMMAQGGIQAADKENDSPAIHYLDVMGGGAFTNDPELVEALVMDAPGVIAWLESLGAMFDKEPDGTMRTIHGGGTSRKRMHAARDYSGAEIMRTLRDEVRSHAGNTAPTIRVWEFRPAVELLLDETGQVCGAVLKDLDTDRLMLVRAKAVIIATGGSGRLHYQGFPTTNHYGATGDGLVLAYRVGAKLAFIDTMQYHPTGAAYPEQILGQLVTEKVRGLGAQVCNKEGEQFVYPAGDARCGGSCFYPRMLRARPGCGDEDRAAGRLAGLADDRFAQRSGHHRPRAAGHGAPVQALWHRYDPIADPGLPDLALPEWRGRHPTGLQHCHPGIVGGGRSCRRHPRAQPADGQQLVGYLRIRSPGRADCRCVGHARRKQVVLPWRIWLSGSRRARQPVWMAARLHR